MHKQSIKNRKQKGFTLFELLVVVSILAAVAGIGASAVVGYEQEAREQLVYSEMNNIAKAIYRFKADTGYFPKEGVFPNRYADEDNPTIDEMSNLSDLFFSPREDGSDDLANSANTVFGAEILAWDIQTARGWNGPYISLNSLQRRSLGDCDLDVGVGDVFIFGVNVAEEANEDSVIAVEDTFYRKTTYSNSDSCFVIKDDNVWVSRLTPGQPYIYHLDYSSSLYPECSANSCIALLSAGPDGQFNNGGTDDIVKILRVNN